MLTSTYHWRHADFPRKIRSSLVRTLLIYLYIVDKTISLYIRSQRFQCEHTAIYWHIHHHICTHISKHPQKSSPLDQLYPNVQTYILTISPRLPIHCPGTWKPHPLGWGLVRNQHTPTSRLPPDKGDVEACDDRGFARSIQNATTLSPFSTHPKRPPSPPRISEQASVQHDTCELKAKQRLGEVSWKTNQQEKPADDFHLWAFYTQYTFLHDLLYVNSANLFWAIETNFLAKSLQSEDRLSTISFR